MFPGPEDILLAIDIADYWSREIQPPKSRDELLADLESAWWLGEIVSGSTIRPFGYLKNLFKLMRKRPNPKVLFIAGSEAGPPQSIELPDGGVELDRRPRIHVPNGDPDTWDENSCARAFQEMAKRPLIEYFP